MLPDTTSSPLLDWSDNNLLDVAASELNSFPPLQAVAEDEKRNICTPSTLSNSLNVPEVMLYVHFSPNYGEHHIKGILNTNGRNCLPDGNTSVNTMYNTWSTSYSYFFHIPPKQAIPITIQQLVWCDILALDGDKDWATDSEKRKDYKRVRGLVDHLSVPFIHDVTELVSNVKYGLVLGDDPWELFSTHKEDLIPEGRVIDVPQTRSVSHPCVFAPKWTYGCTLRQGRQFLESIVAIQAKLLEVPPPVVTDDDVRNIFGTRINSRTDMVYVARYGPNEEIIFYSPDGCEDMKDMIREKGGALTNFPSQADLKSGNVKEVAGLTIEMHAFDSREAVKFRDMEPGAQTGTPQYEEWEEMVKKPKLFVHSVDPGTHLVVSVIGDQASAISQLNNCGNINITEKIASTVNGELKKIDLNFGRGAKPSWHNWKKAKKSIEKGLSVLIYLRIDKKVPGCNVVSHPSGDSYHLPFILSAVQLDSGKEATVKCEKVGVLALSEDDLKAKADKLKVLPQNKRLKFKDTSYSKSTVSVLFSVSQ